MPEPADGLGPDEKAELERLRAEVAALRGRSAETGPPAVPRWRAVLAPLLIVLGSVLLLPATVAVWLDSVVTDTDRYVSAVGPLAEDPAVQNAVTRRVTREVVTAIDVESLVDDIAGGLAERGVGDRATTALQGLSGPLASGVEGWLGDHVGAVVRSDVFADAWVRANRTAHTQVVGLLTDGGTGGALVADGDRLALDLGPVVAAVKQRLVDRGVGVAERIPAVDTQIVLAESESVETARRGFALVDGLGLWLSVIALALIVAGVLLARNRRTAVIRSGLGAVLAMLALGLVLAVARPLYTDALPQGVDAAAARALFDQVVGSLRTTLRAVLVVGLVVAAAAYLTGGSRQARAVRSGIGSLGAVLDRRGWNDTPVARWLGGRKRAAQLLIVVAAALVLVFWDYPSGAVVASIAVVAAVLVILVEVVAPTEPARAA